MNDKKQKIIGIDGNEANVQNRVGVNVYAYQLLRNLSILQDVWKNKYKIIIYLREKPLDDLPKETKYFQYRLLLSNKSFWVLRKLIPYLWKSKEKPHVLLSLSHYTVPFLPFPCICSIMDLGFLDFSEHFKKSTFWQLKYWTAISIFVSKYIIAISKATEKDIVRHYPFSKKKIKVIYLAYDKTKFNNDIPSNDVRHIKEKYSIVDDYILYLGTLKPSKNIEGLLEGYQIIIDSHILENPPKLVIAGKKGWMFEEIYKKVKEYKIEDKVIFTDFIPEEDKPGLYKGSRLVVSPSFTEGFGLHILESMACGTPVVVSKIGSFPEIVGSAGILVDPNQPESIAEGIKKVLTLTEKGYNELKEKCLDQVTKFSWEKTTTEVLDLFEKIHV